MPRRAVRPALLTIIILHLLLAAACSTPEPDAHQVVDEGPTVLRDGRTRSADGLPIAYTAGGEGSPALVFIHGWACDRSHWEQQLAAFAPRHRVVALDLGGHGESGRDRADWSFDRLAGDVEAVVEELDLQRVILVGHSMGGPVSLAAAARLPERVVGIVAVDTFHDAEFHFPDDQWQEWIAAYEADFLGTCQGFVRQFFPYEDADPALVERVVSGMCSIEPEIGIALLRQFPGFDLPAAMAAAGVPIRAVNSTAFMPTAVEVNRRYSPGFDAVELDRVGHFPQMERPDEFNDALARMVTDLLES